MPRRGNPQAWIVKAEQDVRSAEVLARLRTKPVPDSVCFHAQQVAEKYLKALLVWHRISFPRTHDLEHLLLMVVAQDPGLQSLRPALKRLNPFAVVIRYPGGRTTQGRARRALEDALKVRVRIRRSLCL